MLAWVYPARALRYGIYRMPEYTGGRQLQPSLLRVRGEQIELTLQPQRDGASLRALVFRNIANMGLYSHALAAAASHGGMPDIRADDRAGRRKYGLSRNGELRQPMRATPVCLRVPAGTTGAVNRLPIPRWPGRSASARNFPARPGAAHRSAWRGAGTQRLVGPHRDYLRAGGRGFALGDGTLRYGREGIFEAYYNLALGRHMTFSPDLQMARRPGFNCGRGPARFIDLGILNLTGGMARRNYGQKPEACD